jgi:adenosylhomocysteinase
MQAYYVASQQGHKPLAAAATGWLKGEPNVYAELRQTFDVRGTIGKDNAFDFLPAMVALIVHIGYAGLIVLWDEAESIRGISRPESRHAAYENVCFLMDTTAQGAFAHCGFLFSGTEDFFRDDRCGVASHGPLYERLKSDRGKRQTKDPPQAILPLEGFDRRKLHEVALKVRDVHGIAHGWHASGRITDELLQRLVEDTAERVGERLNTMPRGFLKSLVDILDAVERNPRSSAAEIIAVGIDADHIEEIEREEAHLLEYSWRD